LSGCGTGWVFEDIWTGWTAYVQVALKSPPDTKVFRLSVLSDDAYVEEATNPGGMGHRSLRRLSSIPDCEKEAPGGRRAAQAATWRSAIGPDLRKRGGAAGQQEEARSTMCA